MKEFIQRIITELKMIYPNEKISVINGFIGIENKETGRLKHTSYLGNAFYEINGIIYTDCNSKKGVKRVLEIK